MFDPPPKFCPNNSWYEFIRYAIFNIALIVPKQSVNCEVFRVFIENKDVNNKKPGIHALPDAIFIMSASKNAFFNEIVLHLVKSLLLFPMAK